MRPRTVLYKGTPLTLAGRRLKIGDLAPNFRVCTHDMKDLHLSEITGVKILTSFISLDTPVCDLQIKHFNQLVSQIGKNVPIIGISNDLPFAQNRFCSSFSIGNVQLVSDFKTRSFGINFGLLIRDWRLLARAVLIVDSHQLIRYMQIVPEITIPPDYDDVIKNLKIILETPFLPEKKTESSRCIPCTGATKPFTREEIKNHLPENWTVLENTKLTKEFRCPDADAARDFLSWIGIVAEEQGHDPIACINYKKVEVTLTTHAVHGLTENDFIMARIIDEISM